TVPPAIVNDPPLETVIVSVAPVPVPFTFRIFVVTATVAPLAMLSESTAFVFTVTVSVYAPFEPAAFRTMSSPAAGTPLGDQAPAVPQFPFFGLAGVPPPLPWKVFIAIFQKPPNVLFDGLRGGDLKAVCGGGVGAADPLAGRAECAHASPLEERQPPSAIPA